MSTTISDSLNSPYQPTSQSSSPSWDIESISKITVVFFVTLTLLDVSLRVGSLLTKTVIFLNPTIGFFVLVTCLAVAAMAIYQHKKSSEYTEANLSRKSFSELCNIYTIKELRENIFNQEAGNLSLLALQEKFREGLFVAKKLSCVTNLFYYDLDELEKYNICPAEFIRECKDIRKKLDKIEDEIINEQNTLDTTSAARENLRRSLTNTRDSLSNLRSMGSPGDILTQIAALLLVIIMGAQNYSTSTQNVVTETRAKKYYDEIAALSARYERKLAKRQKDYESAYSRHFS